MTAPTSPRRLAGDTPTLRRRRNAERRLKAYGIAAILVATLALGALLWSVVGKAAGALTETYITLPVTLDPALIDPDETGDPDVIRRGNFTSLARGALRDRFPDVTGRAERRALYDLISVGSAFELARRVAADPGLIGTRVEHRFLASDVTDLYLKGAFGGLNDTPVTGRLTVEVQDDTVVLTSSAPDFAGALARVREGLTDEARALRRKAALQGNGVRYFEEALADATTETARTEARAQIAARTAKRDDLIARAEALEARATSDTGTEKIGPAERSVLIRAAGGWFRVTELGRDHARARVLVPPTTAETGDWRLLITDLPERARKVGDAQIAWIETLQQANTIDTVFNWRFFTASDSRDPELAGIRGAVVGSLLTMLVTFALAFPIGVGSAIYLEEFAPKNRFTDLVEVNINNLAAVPSIIFGLLGLSLFIGVFGVPRSAPLAGGMVLALMTLPTIIIAARAAIRAVPPSIREAALGIGASRWQTTTHHVLPLAMPGILTGTIIGMAQALGETAPLLMIGMVAFIVDVPTGITDAATVLPVQIFRWSDFPERAFEAKTAAAICTLLAFLVVMNLIAIVLRRRFERRW